MSIATCLRQSPLPPHWRRRSWAQEDYWFAMRRAARVQRSRPSCAAWWACSLRARRKRRRRCVQKSLVASHAAVALHEAQRR
eukprot:5620273-Prymnesium_polylepis.2